MIENENNVRTVESIDDEFAWILKLLSRER